VQMSRTAPISAIPARSSPSRGSKSYDWAARVYEQPLIPGDHDRERLGDPARVARPYRTVSEQAVPPWDPRQSRDNLELRSPDQHAGAHCQETGHPVTAGLAPGSAWRWRHGHQRLA